MPNASGTDITPDRPRPAPARIPVRGSLALLLTAGGLALLLGFRTPSSADAELAIVLDTGEGSGTPPESTRSPGDPTTAPAARAPTADPVATASPTMVGGSSLVAEPSPLEPGVITAVGDAVDCRWGRVRVQVTVQDGRIVSVETLEMPDGDRRSARISQQVEPILREEALAANGADIDIVSGATYTSRAYSTSLQSALDQLVG